MKTQFILMSTVAVLGASLVTTSYAAPPSEYLHFTRHRDSNGNLLMGPTQHQAEPSVVQKTVMPSQPKTFERRSTDWGMSVEEVKENEPIQSTWELQPPVLGDFEQRVAYHTQIEGVEAALTYTFYQDHLGQAKYVFEPQHEDAGDYVQDFQAIKGWISQSYGAPTSAQEIWLDTLYQYDKSLWGQALKRGHLVMVAEWKNPGTDIVLVLDGGDDTVGLVADFASTTFVVPVSLDTESPVQQVQEDIEDTTIQEALPIEPLADPVVEEAVVQDSSPVMGGSGKFHSETEVASQTPENDIQELYEIEQMLNEEFPIQESGEPVIEGGSVDSSMVEPDSEATPESEASPEGEAEHESEATPMEDRAAQEFGSSEESVIAEASVEADDTVQASVSAEEGEPAFTEEEMVEQMMEAETELEPHHL